MGQVVREQVFLARHEERPRSAQTLLLPQVPQEVGCCVECRHHEVEGGVVEDVHEGPLRVEVADGEGLGVGREAAKVGAQYEAAGASEHHLRCGRHAVNGDDEVVPGGVRQRYPHGQWPRAAGIQEHSLWVLAEPTFRPPCLLGAGLDG